MARFCDESGVAARLDPLTSGGRPDGYDSAKIAGHVGRRLSPGDVELSLSERVWTDETGRCRVGLRLACQTQCLASTNRLVGPHRKPMPASLSVQEREVLAPALNAVISRRLAR